MPLENGGTVKNIHLSYLTDANVAKAFGVSRAPIIGKCGDPIVKLTCSPTVKPTTVGLIILIGYPSIGGVVAEHGPPLLLMNLVF